MELTAETTVKDMLGAHPETFGVLLGHGMCEGCQADPPPVPLGHFAMKHCGGQIEALLQELRGAIQSA